MKSFVVTLLAVTLLTLPSASIPAHAQSANATASSTLIVHVNGIHTSKGVIRLLIFNSQDGWPDVRDKSFRHASLPANGSAVTFTIPNVPAGSYAISVLHDENENHKLDRDLFGRPKEGIGFGNNPKIGFTKPGLRESSVQVAGRTAETTVNLRYP